MDLLSETEMSVRRRIDAGEFVDVCGRLDILNVNDYLTLHPVFIHIQFRFMVWSCSYMSCVGFNHNLIN